MKIVIKHKYGDIYEAEIAGSNPRIYGSGSGINQALGDLVQRNMDLFGIDRMQIGPRQDDYVLGGGF